MKRLGRRSFVKSGALLAGAGGLPFLYEKRAFAAEQPPLVPDPAGILDLAEGFSYRILERQGEPMSDGYRVPGLPDGMGCFERADGTLVLMRNHELQGITTIGAYDDGQAPPQAYDPATHGGVTRLVVDGTTLERVSSNLVLTGTTRNCAGGKSPWGWLSCEESVDAVHGYVFICSPDAASVAPPVKVPYFGHLYHEAATVDPRTNAAYLTEDRGDGCFYRFLPDDPKTPFIGRFQALAVTGRPGFSTATGLTPGDELDVSWVDLPNPDPLTDSLRLTARQLGAAIVCRGEGIWYEQGIVYFTATSGGNVGMGQIFALEPTREGGRLVLVAESTGVDMLDGPDNVTVAPWGDVIVSEDSVTGRAENRIFRITPQGEMITIGLTTLSEVAGVCFTPDGRGLFLNIFGAGITVVVTGPFPPSDPSDDPYGTWDGEGGAGGVPEIPVVPHPPKPVPPTHVQPGCACAEAPGRPSGEGVLPVAAALGAAALALGRGDDRRSGRS